MASALQPYPTSRISKHSYSFTTSAGSIYHCYFFDFGEVFSNYPNLAPNVFGFNLELKHKLENKIIGLDKRIAITVATIIKTFLNEKENVVVYICDTSDNHEKPDFINSPIGSKLIMMVTLFNLKV